MKDQEYDLTIILPTFNEFANIEPLYKEINDVMSKTNINYEIIYIDDSDDKTPKIISEIEKKDSRVCLYHRPKEERTGLSTAFIKGFNNSKGKYICCMDSDLQHPPQNIPEMYNKISCGNHSMVVASRLIDGGSNEGLANLYRRLVSNTSRLISWIILPSTKKTTDPMTGYFMFEKEFINEKILNPIGFKILVELLVMVKEFKVIDVPMTMRKREFNQTKASLTQGINFIKHLYRLRKYEDDLVNPKFKKLTVKYIATSKKFMVFNFKILKRNFSFFIVLAIFIFGVSKLYNLADGLFIKSLLTVAILQIIQGCFALYIMLYAWNHPERIEKDSSPKKFKEPKYSFTAILPAINEANVIGDTIRSLSNIDYPEELKETLVVLRDTDTETIEAAQREIDKIGKDNIRIIIISGPPINKPHHLNAALRVANKDVVCIFDAEDEPHKEIYDVINTVMLRDNVDVVQSGVQLMNYDSNWYSIFNVLEYFIWFRSSLHFFSKQEIIPLGGNTVFFKKEWIKEVGGWDMESLTEDADIGIRLSNAGAKIRVVYDPKHSTKEETPPTIKSFVKQRTRWSQGFLQILFKGAWFNRNVEFNLKKNFLILYILGWPLVHGLMFMSIPVSIAIALFLKLHPIIVITTNIPLLVLLAFMIFQNIALYEFLKIYDKKWNIKLAAKTIFWFLPYQILLGLGSFRAVFRQIKNQTSWEKTEHQNAHRVQEVDNIVA